MLLESEEGVYKMQERHEKNDMILNKFRSLVIGTPPLANFKRLYQTGEMPSKLMSYPLEKNIPTHRPTSSLPKPVPDDMNFLKPTEIFTRKTSVDHSENDRKPLIKMRPPRKRIMKNTISSKVSFNRDNNLSSTNNLTNWKSFEIPATKNFIRSDFYL